MSNNDEEEVYSKIRQTKDFNKLTYKLSAKCHISQSDQQSVLLSYTYIRLTNYIKKNNLQYTDIMDILDGKGSRKQYNYSINYILYNSYKDAMENVVEENNYVKFRSNGKTQELETVELNENLISTMSKLNIRIQVDELIDIIYKIFSGKIANFAASLLLNGEAETMKKFGLTKQQVNYKIDYIKKKINKNRVEYSSILLSPLEEEQLHNMKQLKRIIDLLESSGYTDEKMAGLLQKLSKYRIVNDLLADAYTNMTTQITCFGKFNRQQDYKFINSVYAEYEALSRRLAKA